MKDASKLHRVRDLFNPGRDRHGTIFLAIECPLNALQRRLSCYTDAELQAIRDGAADLISLAVAELMNRQAPDDPRDAPALDPDPEREAEPDSYPSRYPSQHRYDR